MAYAVTCRLHMLYFCADAEDLLTAEVQRCEYTAALDAATSTYHVVDDMSRASDA